MSTSQPGRPNALGVDLHGRVALVSAAAGAGIGRACVRALGDAGASVAVTDLHEPRCVALASQLAESAGVAAIGLSMDVTDEEQVRHTVATVEDSLGPIDILVNNSGFSVPGKLCDTTTEAWNRVLSVSLTGHFFLLRAVLPAMFARRRGSVVNIASVAAWTTAEEGMAAYSAAKAGVLALTRNAAAEAGPFGVRVNSVAPGATPNNYLEGVVDPSYFESFASQTPLALATPESVAQAVLYLASDASDRITGECINVSGGFYLRP